MTTRKRIKSIRESKGFTQNKPANIIHAPPSYVNRIANKSSESICCMYLYNRSLTGYCTSKYFCDIFIMTDAITASKK